jgi:uncharacterized cupin superfamily protein
MPRRIDPKDLPAHLGTFYPPPYHQPCKARERRKLGDAAGLTQFGVNLLRLKPGVWSSQRHWHAEQDEFVYVISGEVVLVTDAGEEILKAGECAGFKAGDRDGHHLQNRGDRDAVLLEVGTRTPTESGEYPDIDMAFQTGGPAKFTRKDGTPYADIKQRGPDDD